MKIADALRGQPPKNYIRHNLSAVARLGLRDEAAAPGAESEG